MTKEWRRIYCKKSLWNLFFVFIAMLPVSVSANGFSQEVVLSEWRIEDAASSTILSNEWVSLRNNYFNKKIEHSRYNREYGINLDWSTSVRNNIRFLRQDNTGPLKIGERVAIYVKKNTGVPGGGYIYNAKRDYGIDLKWSSSPKFEWELRGGEGEGDSIEPNVSYGIYNTKHRDFIVYCGREYGINIKWNSDCTCRIYKGCNSGGASQPPEKKYICGIGGCDSGWHDVSFQYSVDCVGTSKNQTTCEKNDDNFIQCGIGNCPIGWHETRFIYSQNCALGASIDNNATQCVQDSPPGFWTCETHCPEGYSETNQGSNMDCNSSRSSTTPGETIYCSAGTMNRRILNELQKPKVLK